jgi:hypothetical protein
LITHALVPAIAEEWFFRGFLLRALLAKAKHPAGPILISGLIFGAFHLLAESVIAIDRFVPTTLMGILLAFVCWRTGSILPGIVLHMLNNATVVGLAYYSQEFQQWSWFPFKNDQLPWSWTVVLLLIAAAAIAGLWFATSRRESEVRGTKLETNQKAE